MLVKDRLTDSTITVCLGSSVLGIMTVHCASYGTIDVRIAEKQSSKVGMFLAFHLLKDS